MAELTISPDEVRSAIESYISSFSPEASREEIGVVAETGDPAADRTLVILAHHDAAHSGLVFHPALGQIGASRQVSH